MTNFFESLDPEEAAEIEQLSRLIWELRENRNAVLKLYDADDEDALLKIIQAGTVDEHPAYEHYLAARVLTNTCETVRTLVRERLMKANQS